MKKIIATILALVMVLSLAACGGKTEEPTSGNDTPNVEQPKEETKAPAVEAPAPTEEPAGPWGVTDNFTAFANDTFGGYYINFPELTGVPKGSGLVAYQSDGSLVIVDGQIIGGTIEVGSVDEVLPAYFEQTIIMMDLYRNSAYDNFAFEIASQEHTTVNGYEMCKYAGVHSFTMDGVAATNNFVAYATQLNSNGAYVYWMVLDETADQSLGNTIADHAYRMALSLVEE